MFSLQSKTKTSKNLDAPILFFLDLFCMCIGIGTWWRDFGQKTNDARKKLFNLVPLFTQNFQKTFLLNI
jgi:hypothetical protein